MKRRRSIGAFLVFVSVVLGARPAGAQYQTRSWLAWKTIQSGRFAVHFPDALEPWARIVAGRTRAIDSAVTRVVGYEPPQRIDIVIDDPFHIANGSSWPLLDAPRIVMWATPPSPREDIGTFVSWADMLTTHEFTHLAHLLRPTRNALQDWLWKVAPVELGPLSIKSPRWVIEGYATYVEGVVTGSGRPNGVWRPTILRQWALEGVLPAYGALNSTRGMYGGEFAYLAGSSFLQWLAERRGDSSLVALWRRMSARQDRTFGDAFTGVYGEGPDILYGRFTAEVTAAARLRQSQLAGDTGTTIQHLARETGDPAISRDGGRAAIVLASATRPGRVVIWRTIPEPDTGAARAARALRESDPEDVAPYRPFPPPKKVLATLPAVGNQSYQDPRFFTDGRVLVWRNTALGDGSWLPDLYVWDPQRGSVRRITRRGNVQNADPSPDGRTIAGTRCGLGRCDLVLVDARTGAVTVASEGSDTRSFYRPRYSADGKTIAVAVHDGGYWRAGLLDVATHALRVITDGARDYFDVSYADDSTLLASADESGVLNVVRLRTDGRVLGRVTSVSGAAVAPEVNPADGSIWFLSLHARGWDVRAVRPSAPIVMAAPAVKPAPHLLPSAPAPPTKGYSPDRKWIWFPGGSLVRDGGTALLGLANTDPAGRTELLAQGAKSLSPRSFNAGLEGASVTLTRRSRLPMAAALFSVEQDGPFWYTLRGASVMGEDSRRFERWSWRSMIGATWSRVASPYESVTSKSARFLSFGDISLSASRFRNGRRSTGQVSVQFAEGSRAGEGIDRFIATGTIASTEIPFAFTAQYGESRTGAPGEKFVLGGNPPTLLPAGVLSQFIGQPALSPFFVGARLETYRLSVPIGLARLYGWAGRAYEGPVPPFERVIGIEGSASIVAIPVLGTPAAHVTMGVGRWMNHRAILRGSPVDPRVFVTPGGNVQFYVTTQFGDWAR